MPVSQAPSKYIAVRDQIIEQTMCLSVATSALTALQAAAALEPSGHRQRLYKGKATSRLAHSWHSRSAGWLV